MPWNLLEQDFRYKQETLQHRIEKVCMEYMDDIRNNASLLVLDLTTIYITSFT